MPIDEVAHGVAEGDTRHQIEHAGGQSDIGRAAQVEHEAGAGDDGRCQSRKDGDGAVVYLPFGEPLFEVKSEQRGHKYNEYGGPVTAKQAAERRVGQAGQQEHPSPIETRDLLHFEETAARFFQVEVLREHLVAEAAQTSDGIKIDTRMTDWGDAGIRVFARQVPKVEDDVGREDSKLGFHLPRFGHLFEVALNAHGRSGAAEQGTGIVAEKLGKYFEPLMSFFLWRACGGGHQEIERR